MGPSLIHHSMEYTSYHGFFSQLLGQLPEFCHVKAIGSDGETALCIAIEATLPAAVHLHCIKHLRDDIERKLKDMHFDQQAITELKAYHICPYRGRARIVAGGQEASTLIEAVSE